MTSTYIGKVLCLLFTFCYVFSCRKVLKFIHSFSSSSSFSLSPRSLMATAGSPKILVIPASQKESEEVLEEPMFRQRLTVWERLCHHLFLANNLFFHQLKQLLVRLSVYVGLKKTLLIEDGQREAEEAEGGGEGEERVGVDGVEPVIVPLRWPLGATPPSKKKGSTSLYRRSRSLEELSLSPDKAIDYQQRSHSGSFTPESAENETISIASLTKLLIDK